MPIQSSIPQQQHSVSKTIRVTNIPFGFLLRSSTMSTCGNCDCADKSQCVKKGNGYGIEIIETEKSYVDSVVDAPFGAEAEGECKCGATCACVDCHCGQ